MRVAQVWRYPVKSMLGERLDAIELDEAGVVGDRAFGLRDSTTGVVLTARTARPLLHVKARLIDDRVCITLPDGRTLLGDDEHTDLALSAHVRTPVHLARAKADETATFEAPGEFSDGSAPTVQWRSRPGTFNDGHPVHLLTTASLRGGGALHPEGEWDARRFRPNILVESDGDDFPEDGWASIRIGSVGLEVYKRTTRCAMTARAQPGLDDDLGIPEALARNRRSRLGVYARVTVGGTVALGDEVRTT